MTNEIIVGAVVGITSAVVGSLLTAWSSYRFQLEVLKKQIELNKEMHTQLLAEQQAFAEEQEHKRRAYDRSQDFHKEARQRTQGR